MLNSSLTEENLPLRNSEEIQGNILAAFNKDYQTFFFLNFPDGDGGRAWLKELLPRISSTKEVAAFNERFSSARRLRGGDDPPNLTALWMHISLTYHGLTALSPKLADDLQSFTAFQQGPVGSDGERAALLGDTGLSDPSRWIIGGPNQAKTPIDALLIVAADDLNTLSTENNKLRALASKYGLLTVFEQHGATLPGASRGHEHFGFKDGISQPGVKGFDRQDPRSGSKPQVLGHLGSSITAAGEFVLGYERQPFALPGDSPPWPHPEWMKDGSFLVFRRLQQDVPGFWAQVTRNAHSLPSDEPMEEELLAAKLIGRWRSGRPIELAPEKDNPSLHVPVEDNNFDYQTDPAGYKCPQFAHIRKAVPRNDEVFHDEQHRILRRGIPFGLPFNPAAGTGQGVDAERGLLFVAFMASIEGQFEFLYHKWINSPTFPFPDANAGPDPLIGQAQSPAPVLLRQKDQPDKPESQQPLEFQCFVHTTGAVYAFSPSLSALGQLADGKL